MKRIITIDDDMVVIIKKITNIQRKIDDLEEKGKRKIVIFGCGEHTQKLLDFIDFSKYELRVCDTIKVGKIQKYEIEKPQKELFLWADTIIISTVFFYEEMMEIIHLYGCNNKVIKLYDFDKDKVPFYKTEVSIDADVSLDDIDIADENKYKVWTIKGSGKKYEGTVERAFFNSVIKEYFLNYINQDDVVCEIGAGTGRLTVEIAKKTSFDHIVAIDTSADMLNVLESEIPVETRVVTDEKLPFSDETFDKVVACDVIVHFSEWRKFLREHTRVLKKGGLIIYNICNDDHAKMVSDNKKIRGWYFSGKRSQYVTISREELEKECKCNGLVLEGLIPYGLLNQSGFCYGNMSRAEMMHLTQLYRDMFKNKKIEPILNQIETKIVKELPDWMTFFNICVIRKL